MLPGPVVDSQCVTVWECVAATPLMWSTASARALLPSGHTAWPVNGIVLQFFQIVVARPVCQVPNMWAFRLQSPAIQVERGNLSELVPVFEHGLHSNNWASISFPLDLAVWEW